MSIPPDQTSCEVTNLLLTDGEKLLHRLISLHLAQKMELGSHDDRHFAMGWRSLQLLLLQVKVAPAAWRVPWYFDCRHNSEWTHFKTALEVLGDVYQEEVFWWSQALLERIEPSFLRVQNTDHLFFLCNPNGSLEYDEWVPVQSDEDSVFRLSTGTGQWTKEEQESRSYALGDFCYFGYMAAIAYRTRNTDSSIPGVLEGRKHAMTLLQNFLMSRANSVDFLESSGWMKHETLLKHIYPDAGPGRQWSRHLRDDPDRPLVELGLKAAETGPQPLALRVAAIGYHTTLVLELISLWEEFLSDQSLQPSFRVSMVWSLLVSIPALLCLRADVALAVRADIDLEGDLPDCSAWQKNLPGKWKAKIGFTTQERKDYLQGNPDPCSEYGLKCCSGLCLLEGCKPLNCRKCNSQMKISKVPAPLQKKICQDTQVCHDTVNLDKARGCAFTLGKCASTKYSCEQCNLYHPVNEQSTLGQLSKAVAACEDTTFCYYPGDKYRYADGWLRLHFAVHVLEPGLGTAEQVRAASVCKDFQSYGDLCGWDARLLGLNVKHFTRVTLPLAALPSPQIKDPDAFVQDFVAAFRDDQLDAEGHRDLRIEGADLFLCTEPAFLCNAMGRAFPDRPLVGYFANPLTAYLPAFAAGTWLSDFLSLSRNQLMERSAPFLAVASTRFLAEQVRFQTGAPRVYTARPLAAYLGPVRGESSDGEVIVLRQPSMFWNSACILNSMARMNMAELETFQETSGNALRAASLRFVASEELADASSEAIAAFKACVIFPYDVSQMRLYELYALSLPLFVPERRQLASYIYRGLTTIEDFNHVLTDAGLQGKGWRSSDISGPHLDYNPFDRDWLAADAWTQLTHWVSLPHLVRFASAAELLKCLLQEDLRRVAAAMQRQQTRDVLRAARFWTAALSHLDAPKSSRAQRLKSQRSVRGLQLGREVICKVQNDVMPRCDQRSCLERERMGRMGWLHEGVKPRSASENLAASLGRGKNPFGWLLPLGRRAPVVSFDAIFAQKVLPGDATAEELHSGSGLTALGAHIEATAAGQVTSISSRSPRRQFSRPLEVSETVYVCVAAAHGLRRSSVELDPYVVVRAGTQEWQTPTKSSKTSQPSLRFLYSGLGFPHGETNMKRLAVPEGAAEDESEETAVGYGGAGWLQFEAGAHAHIMAQHSTEEMQIILYRGRDLVLYDAHHHRAFARRVTQEQAQERKLGSGSFGSVYLCTHMMDEIELGIFAVKKLALGDDARRLRQVVREVKALEKLRHMNVIDYKHSWLEIDRHSELCPYVPFLYILMEYCNYGSLEGFIWHKDPGFIRGRPDNARRSRELSEEMIWHFFHGSLVACPNPVKRKGLIPDSECIRAFWLKDLRSLLAGKYTLVVMAMEVEGIQPMMDFSDNDDDPTIGLNNDDPTVGQTKKEKKNLVLKKKKDTKGKLQPDFMSETSPPQDVMHEWSTDVPDSIWKDPSLTLKDWNTATAEQVQRALDADEACRTELHSLLLGKQSGLDQAWARSWVEALMMPGEKPLLELHCIAFNGMPQITGTTDCFGGRGLLIFSKLDDSRHRLHFLFQEEQQELEAHEGAETSKEWERQLNWRSVTCRMKTRAAAVQKHAATYRMMHRTIALEVQSNILLAHTEMRNLANHTHQFESGHDHEHDCTCEFPPKCCTIMCPRCPKCPTCCDICCCNRKLVKMVGEAVEVSTKYKKSFPDTEEACEEQNLTLALPNSKTGKEEWPGKDKKTSKTAQMNLLSILYRLPGSTTPAKFTAWVDPCHSIKHNARFAHELSAIARPNQQTFHGEGVHEPAPLARDFADQFHMLFGAQSNHLFAMSWHGRRSTLQTLKRLPRWAKLYLLLLAIGIVVGFGFLVNKLANPNGRLAVADRRRKTDRLCRNFSHAALFVAGQSAAFPRPLLSDFGTCQMMGDVTGEVHGGYAIEFCSPERLENEEIGEKGDGMKMGSIG
eukprot:s797_g11.t4